MEIFLYVIVGLVGILFAWAIVDIVREKVAAIVHIFKVRKEGNRAWESEELTGETEEVKVLDKDKVAEILQIVESRKEEKRALESEALSDEMKDAKAQNMTFDDYRARKIRKEEESAATLEREKLWQSMTEEPEPLRCPQCRSTQLSADKKGFGVGKAIVGGALLGGVGLLGGFIGSRKVQITCLNCGKTWKPG